MRGTASSHGNHGTDQHGQGPRPGQSRAWADRTFKLAAESPAAALDYARGRVRSQGLIAHPYRGEAEPVGPGLFVVKIAAARPW